ncbi:tubulin-specific chaperone A-like isoform X2 [Tupaia chinensis]|uniref:tubulin-specific chaperone A-like isoform X2 n=1 Tax=Tupaia chinensis TaxID=246437 RepID=UPI000704032D|nr:tubulin-specific chaperone A-like isoform X2 [Tupaia chinensis]
MADPYMRQIKMKTGVVKRFVKGKAMYENEAKQQEMIGKMKAEDGENYAIKNQILEKEKDLEEAEDYKEVRLVLDSVKLEA